MNVYEDVSSPLMARDYKQSQIVCYKREDKDGK